ncbi:MAG: glycosyltransferase [Muribaculaceae bacterium]|nr:glycosyltransferase [Muribaculaceae bacterium]
MIIITNLPSFYKINLYNEINRHKKIFVIFSNRDASDRNKDFFNGSMEFDHIFLSGSFSRKVIAIRNILHSHPYSEFIISGWDEPVFWASLMLSPKRKNAVVIESSIYESRTTGLKGFVKKGFIRRISKCYASGKPQRQLAEQLGFKGEMVITKGVGLKKLFTQPPYEPRTEVKRFLFVGRLVKVKNLEFLIRRFNDHPELELTIAGFGELEDELRKIASQNIRFVGAIPNDELGKYYREADVMVLPSMSEPWGLVVEEALNNGTPCMVSDRVGAADDMIGNKYGIIFSLSEKDFEDKLSKIRDIHKYNILRKNISTLDFKALQQSQIDAYL